MRINFVTEADKTMASFRYHNLIPALQLKSLGHEVGITRSAAIDADVYIFSKHLNFTEYWTLLGLKSSGKKTVFHCCDNHFDTASVEKHYRRMIGAADLVLASTPEMAAVIKQETGVEAMVVPDAYELEEKPPVFNPEGKLKVLWYGHPLNIQCLVDIVPSLTEYDVRLCTYPKLPKALEGFRILPYSAENLKKAFDWCDVVIIPSRMDSKKLVKSHNRLIEAVRQGKFVVANSLPAYREFSEWMWIGDIAYGLKMIASWPKQEVENRIRLAQAYIKENYCPSKIGGLWETALKESGLI